MINKEKITSLGISFYYYPDKEGEYTFFISDRENEIKKIISLEKAQKLNKIINIYIKGVGVFDNLKIEEQDFNKIFEILND